MHWDDVEKWDGGGEGGSQGREYIIIMYNYGIVVQQKLHNILR